MALVLVVGERRDSRQLLVKLLDYAGHQALEADDGQEALRVTQAESPDLVVTDIAMPRMDGYELVRRLRTEQEIRQPRVVFCADGPELDEARDRAAGSGVFTVIARSAKPAEMLSAMTLALETDLDGPEMPAEEFARALRLLNEKLLEKVAQLDEANADRSRLLADLVKAHEVERTRIASDIHDDSIQVMSAASLRLEMLGDDLVASEHGETIGLVAENVREAVGRLRRLIFDLSPRALESGGLGPAIGAYLREVGLAAGFEWKIEDGLRNHLTDQVKAILYRIAQEAIRNAEKHAQAACVTVALDERDGGCVLRIADDGVGFSEGVGQEHRPGHVGLPSMRERAAMAGGTFGLETAPGAGCAIEVWVPDPASHPAPASPVGAVHTGPRGQESSP